MSDVRHPWRGLLLATVICVAAGVFIFANYFYDAFPEASVKFDLPKGEATQKATEFLWEQGEEAANQYHRSIVFSMDRMASIYLEREVGLERANRLMADSVAVWFWYLRFFQPLQKLEYELHYTPSGRLAKYSRYLEEDASGAFLSLDSARALAEEFLAAQQISIADLEEKHAASQDMPSRRDHSFEWEERDFRAAESTLRYRVEIQGDEIGFFREYVKVPESWQRAYQKSRASNELYQNLAQLLAILLGVGMIVMLFRQIRRRLLAGRVPLRLGIALAIGLFLLAVNSLPLAQIGYDTTDSFTSFYLKFLLVAVFGSAMTGAMLWLAAQSGEPLYRRLLPEKLGLEKTFTVRATRTRAFARATVAGYAMTFAHIGAVILFYLFGKKIGFWVPQEVDYSNAVSSFLPWLYPLVISFYAATFEEFTFRFFAIPFLKKIFRSTLPAVILPALIWGFLHSAYPQEPGWVRGIEVGAIGVVAGYMMLRFGILATLVWHYTVDAFFIGFFLLKSGSTYLVVSGVLVCAVLIVPLIVALAYVIRTRTFGTAEGLTNRDIETQIAEHAVPTAPPAQAPSPDVTWQAPRWRKARWLIWAGITSLSILILIAVPLTRIGDGIRWKVSPENAKEISRAFLSKQNIEVGGWRCVVDAPKGDLTGSPVRYLSREAGSDNANRFVKKLSLARFDVHFFKPLQKEMMVVKVNAEGDVIGLSHILDEKAQGDSLSQDSARIIAETFLTRELGFDTSGFYLLSSSSTARDARMDHHFTYQTDRDSVGAARLRIHANVLGNRPSGGGLYLHVPEEWKRGDAEETALRTLSRFFIIGLWGALLVLLIVTLIGGVRSGDIKWRSGVTLSFLVGFLSILSLWNRWPSLVAQLYDTSKPFGSWTTSTLAVSLASVIILSLLVFTIVPLMRRQFEQTLARPYSFSGWAPAEDVHTQRQSIAGAILAIVAIAAIAQFLWWLTLTIGLPTRNAPGLWIGHVAERWPFISLLLSALVKAIFGTAIMGFILLWLWPRVKNWAVRIAVIVLIPLLFALEEGHGAPEIFGEWIRVFGVLLLVIVLLKYYLQQSPMMLFAAIWLGIAIPDSLLWLRQGSGFYTLQGTLTLIAAIVPLFLWKRFSSRPASEISSKITGE